MGPALDRHIALAGFMGAGKTTLGWEAARRMGLEFRDVDKAVERRVGDSIAEYVESHGEEAFRREEEDETLLALETDPPSVLALGGGAVTSAAVRQALRERAVTVLIDVDVDTAWRRARSPERPLTRDEALFRTLHEERRPLYQQVADATADDVDGIVLVAAGVHVETGALEKLDQLVPGSGPVALVADTHVAGIYGADVQLGLGGRLVSIHELPPGEEAKTLATADRLWNELGLDREGTVVALGGGSVTDVAGFVAATHLRGVAWVAVPTTLVGQVDAAIGGKTGIDLPSGKNLVGAFHWPVRTVLDPALLATLPERERRAGLAEAVKTGLLAGEPLWELPERELVRRCAAFKAAVCLRDPYEHGERAVLNLGHTFAHALETASGYEVAHGDAVALGLVAALRLSEERFGLDPASRRTVEHVLAPVPVRADRGVARAALARDKKSKGGRPRLVLLEAPGRAVLADDVPEEAVHAALDELLAG